MVEEIVKDDYKDIHNDYIYELKRMLDLANACVLQTRDLKQSIENVLIKMERGNK